jgi:hypothetical protein
MAEQLGSPCPWTLIAADFAFGLPWNSDSAVFGVRGWRALIAAIGVGLPQHANVRRLAAAINGKFGTSGPFRFDADRNDFRFYLEHGVSYFRLADQCAAQAISAWYMGSGPTVSCSSLTGMGALDQLLAARDRDLCRFSVWPQEGIAVQANGHVLAEAYPSLLPSAARQDPKSTHARDALRIVSWLREQHLSGAVGKLFAPAFPPFGRYESVAVEDQIRFEGWILGLALNNPALIAESNTCHLKPA